MRGLESRRRVERSRSCAGSFVRQSCAAAAAFDKLSRISFRSPSAIDPSLGIGVPRSSLFFGAISPDREGISRDTPGEGEGEGYRVPEFRPRRRSSTSKYAASIDAYLAVTCPLHRMNFDFSTGGDCSRTQIREERIRSKSRAESTVARPSSFTIGNRISTFDRDPKNEHKRRKVNQAPRERGYGNLANFGTRCSASDRNIPRSPVRSFRIPRKRSMARERRLPERLLSIRSSVNGENIRAAISLRYRYAVRISIGAESRD